jgi:hypothetical protein
MNKGLGTITQKSKDSRRWRETGSKNPRNWHNWWLSTDRMKKDGKFSFGLLYQAGYNGSTPIMKLTIRDGTYDD